MSKDEGAVIFILVLIVVAIINRMVRSQNVPENKVKNEQIKQKIEESARRERVLRAATNASEDDSVRFQAQDFILENSPTQREVEIFASMGNQRAFYLLLLSKHFPFGRSKTAGCLSILRYQDDSQIQMFCYDGQTPNNYKLEFIHSRFDKYVCDGSLSELVELERVMVSLIGSHFFAKTILEEIRLNISQKRFAQIRDGK